MRLIQILNYYEKFFSYHSDQTKMYRRNVLDRNKMHHDVE